MKNIKPLPKKYIFAGGSVNEIYVIDGDKFVHSHHIFSVTTKLYDTKEDAMYENFIYKMQHGSKLQSFKKSSYYDYYYERAKKDNPEFLI